MKINIKKLSPLWLVVLIVYSLIIYLSVILSQVIAGTTMSPVAHIGFAIISFIIAITVCIGGFLGRKIYFRIFSLGILIGIIYMLFTVIFKYTKGWSDIVSVLNFITVVAISFGASVVLDAAIYIYSRFKKDRRKKCKN